jgi:hypothetical protein
MTIHWEALEDHFLMALLVFRFPGENAFSEFFSKPQSLRVKSASPQQIRWVINLDSMKISALHINMSSLIIEQISVQQNVTDHQDQFRRSLFYKHF